MRDGLTPLQEAGVLQLMGIFRVDIKGRMNKSKIKQIKIRKVIKSTMHRKQYDEISNVFGAGYDTPEALLPNIELQSSLFN